MKHSRSRSHRHMYTGHMLGHMPSYQCEKKTEGLTKPSNLYWTILSHKLKCIFNNQPCSKVTKRTIKIKVTSERKVKGHLLLLSMEATMSSHDKDGLDGTHTKVVVVLLGQLSAGQLVQVHDLAGQGLGIL